MATDSQILDAIRGVIESTDDYRTRERRDAFYKIKSLVVDGFDAPDEEIEDASPKAPPKAGPGSSRDAWKDYAEALELPVADEDSKAEIIEAVEAATE